MDYECQCSGNNNGCSSAILFNILSQADIDEPAKSKLNYLPPKRCHCEMHRIVRLKTPTDTCWVASSVLVKTVYFMKSLPAFQQLPPKDQLVLLQSCWVPLFILGLAQEHVCFEVEDTTAPSMLQRILLNHQDSKGSDREQPTMAGVQKLKTCLKKFWNLDLSPKEYAYLKGTMIFNPDVPGLQAAPFINSLQQEAQNALGEVLLLLHPEDQRCFPHVLLASSSLKSITSDLITELFFRPIIGKAHLLDLLADMLFSRC
ncbi:nuclear receptor subfamily 0 group B member 2a [Electrophorus electricus]|uniref:nuclear receptor subfamily 0 group B member 2a n=1 Tax=Electrophorus electricus TaxID=8005 RepID=UPI0015D005E6|nr:nuclear receptor subfamily 0 group B member 2a [Electrophorus electricus]